MIDVRKTTSYLLNKITRNIPLVVFLLFSLFQFNAFALSASNCQNLVCSPPLSKCFVGQRGTPSKNYCDCRDNSDISIADVTELHCYASQISANASLHSVNDTISRNSPAFSTTLGAIDLSDDGWDFKDGNEQKLSLCKSIFSPGQLQNATEDDKNFMLTCYPITSNGEICYEKRGAHRAIESSFYSSNSDITSPRNSNKWRLKNLDCGEVFREEGSSDDSEGGNAVISEDAADPSTDVAADAGADVEITPPPAVSEVQDDPNASGPSGSDGSTPSTPDNLSPRALTIDRDDSEQGGNSASQPGDDSVSQPGGESVSESRDGDSSEVPAASQPGSPTEPTRQAPKSIVEVIPPSEETLPPITGRMTPENKKTLCEALDIQIPRLNEDLNKADVKIDQASCESLKQALNGEEISEENPAEDFIDDLDCDGDDTEEYAKMREIYNKLTARVALMEQIKNEEITLDSINASDELRKRALYRLNVMLQTFGINKRHWVTKEATESNIRQEIQQKVNEKLCPENQDARKIKDRTKCLELFDNDFFNKLTAVMKIGFECSSATEGKERCIQNSSGMIDNLHARVIEILQESDQVTTEEVQSTQIGALTLGAEKTSPSNPEGLLTQMCAKINNEVILANSGKSLATFRNQLYSPKNRMADVKEKFAEVFSCEFGADVDDDEIECGDIFKDDNPKLNQQLLEYQKVLGQIKGLINGSDKKKSPGEDVIKAREFLSAAIQAQHAICRRDDEGKRIEGAGELKFCEGGESNLRLFISQNEKVVHKLDEFASFDPQNLNQRAAFDKLLRLCRSRDDETYERNHREDGWFTRGHAQFCRNALGQVETRNFQKTQEFRDYQEFERARDNGCQGNPTCAVTRSYNDETGKWDYNAKMYSNPKSTWGYAAQGLVNGFTGFGARNYYGQPSSFQNMMGYYNQATYGIPAMSAYTMNYLVPYHAYRNSYMQQYSEAMMNTYYGNPQVFNWSLFSGQNFSAMSAAYPSF